MVVVPGRQRAGRCGACSGWTPTAALVDKLTDGKVAYVYVPNTANEGYVRFNRYFFAQAGRDGVIVDERFNGGGLLADHIIDYLRAAGAELR